jgi:protein associated with RNAse G/E
VKELLVHSTKYDGSLHYRYPVNELQRSDDLLITFTSPGYPVQSYRGEWIGKKRLLSFFWKNRPYVLHVRWEESWIPEFLYVDIAAETRWDDRVVRYIDLDLDLILRHESTSIHLDDEDEFEEHQVRWNYPPQLVAQCREAAVEVRKLLELGQPPFSTVLFSWRPGSPAQW